MSSEENKEPTATTEEKKAEESPSTTAPDQQKEEEEAAKKAKEEEEAKKKAEEEEAAKKRAEEEEAAKKKAEEEEAKKKAEEEEAEKKKVAALEKELEELDSEIKELEEKKEALKPFSDEEKEESRVNLKEAQEKHQEAVKAFNDAEQEKFEVQPAYEQCLANKEQKERAEVLSRDIETAENKLKEDEAVIVKLDDQMTKVSADYSEARNALETFTKALRQELAALEKATEEKLAKTIVVPSEAEAEKDERVADHRKIVSLVPMDCLDALESIVYEREHEIHHASRQLRELKAICGMKEEEEDRLSKEIAEASAQKQQENDDYIKNLIYSFQDIRANLQADIEEIRKVNQEQAYNLRRGHVEKGAAERNSFSTDSGRGKTSAVPKGGRQSSFRKDEQKTNEYSQMVEKNEELQTELNTLKKKLTDSTTNRTEALKTLKSLKARVARDEERFREELRELDARIAAENYAVEVQEVENKRLAEAVEHLTFVVQSTRQQVSHIRSHKDPLPIEDVEE